jgi:cell division protein FtsI/penicillin-binding protein 2
MRENWNKNKDFLEIFWGIFDKYPREYFAIGFFIIFLLVIIFKVFSYTVLEYTFYNQLAYKQQVWEISVPVTRWTIYFSASEPTISWTSVDLNDLAIDPQVEWDKVKLWVFLKDIVYKQICYLKSKEQCYNNVLNFLWKLEIENFENKEIYIKELIHKEIIKEISNTKITSVLLATELNNEKISLLSRLWLSWVYLNWDKLYINPEEITNRDLLATNISEILWVKKQGIFYKIRKRDKRYTPIINKLSINISDEIEQFLKEEKQSIRQWILEKQESIWGFIILNPNSHRLYPEQNNASQIMWFLNSEWIGHYGIEWYFNDLLRWENTQLLSKRDSLWRIIGTTNSIREDKTLWEWVDIYTTIDRNIQKNVEKILKEWVKKYRAVKWTIVVMNPMNWEILSMANYPSFDLNNPWDVYKIEKVSYVKYPKPEIDLLWIPVFIEDKEKWDKYYYDSKEIFLRKAKREELNDYELVKYKFKNDFWDWVYKNDAISSLYEPWSIMKAMTVAIWIDSEEIKKDDMYMDKGFVTIDQFTISNDSRKCKWYNTFWHALNYSCNVWMLRIAQKVWKVIFTDYLNSFGFWELTTVTLEWEVFSEIPHYEKWSMAKLFTSSYWLWISVTPLHMAVAYSIIANWWVYIKPNIIKKIKFPDGRVVNYKKDITRRVIQNTTSKIVSSMLVDSVNKWVAWNWKVLWYNVAWKTWTSQIAYKWKYEEWEWSTIWSFVWFWPYEDPKFVIVVKLERPKVSNYWGATSAFIFADVASYLFDYYWIPKNSEINKLSKN